MTNYDVIRVERKTAEYTVINSSVEKRAQNREKTTSGDYWTLEHERGGKEGQKKSKFA